MEREYKIGTTYSGQSIIRLTVCQEMTLYKTQYFYYKDM